MSDSAAGDKRQIDPTTNKPIGPIAQPGYYPDLSTLAQRRFWDAATRAVVEDRVENVPPIRHFNAIQARAMQAICDRILPQDDREDARRIPIVPEIDKRLFESVHSGYRYEDMPPDPEAYALGLQAIEEIANAQHHRAFADIGPREQDVILKSLHDGKPAAGHAIWERMAVHRFWLLLVGDCAEAYYAHPWAWDEIGFGGPAYPRGYMRLEHGLPEPWESKEYRYEWKAPETSLSSDYDEVGGLGEHPGVPNQGGTH